MSEDSAVEDTITYYIFVKEHHKHFDPQCLGVGTTTTEWIFSVPEPNAVGIIDKQNNGIAFIKFGAYGKDPECMVIAQNFSPLAYGCFYYRFSPNVADNMIVYAKTRIAVLTDVKTGEAFHVECGLSLDDYLLGIRFLDPQKKLFVIMKTIDDGSKGVWKNHLHIAKLEDQELIDTGWSIYLGETDDISPYPPLYNAWYVHDHKLFAYNNGQVLCTDGYQSVSHPFSKTFNANTARFGTVKDLAIHPKLPFGVIIEESAPKTHDLIVLRWDIPDPKKKGKQVIAFGQTLVPLKSLFNMDHMTLAYPSFSPDGNWYVVGCIDGSVPQYEP